MKGSALEAPKGSTRLGRRHLGFRAYEQHMPTRLHRLLSQHDIVRHQIDGVIPVLEALLRQDANVCSARLCDPGVPFIGKLKHGIFGEGHHFCGYHNIQMQVAYLRCLGPPYPAAFDKGIPSILLLQDLIEDAWAKGINAQGSVQTGGIRNTRKHIGTLEAQAALRLAGVSTKAAVVKSHGNKGLAYEDLLRLVALHYDEAGRSGVRGTKYPPIYLQRLGHSVTIVGIETTVAGEQSLLVFDPAYALPKDIHDLANQSNRGKELPKLLCQFRRGARQMKRYNDFELLWIDTPLWSNPNSRS